MWFKVADGIYIPGSEVVGFFSPHAAGASLKVTETGAALIGAGNVASPEGAETGAALEGTAGGAGAARPDTGKIASRTRAFVLLKDGTTIASPFGVAALKERFRRPGV